MPMIVAFSMDAFSSVAGNATPPAWHASMPSGGSIHPITLVGDIVSSTSARAEDVNAAWRLPD